MLRCAESAPSDHRIIRLSVHPIIGLSNHPHRPCTGGGPPVQAHSRPSAPISPPQALTSRKEYPDQSDHPPKTPDPPAASLTCNRQTPSDRRLFRPDPVGLPPINIFRPDPVGLHPSDPMLGFLQFTHTPIHGLTRRREARGAQPVHHRGRRHGGQSTGGLDLRVSAPLREYRFGD